MFCLQDISGFLLALFRRLLLSCNGPCRSAYLSGLLSSFQSHSLLNVRRDGGVFKE